MTRHIQSSELYLLHKPKTDLSPYALLGTLKLRVVELARSNTKTAGLLPLFLSSFDEHALIDLPAMLDYVIAKTGQEKIFYVGHSQGTIMGFAGFTANQTLASHIETFFALAPVTTVQHIQGGVMIMAEFDIDVCMKVHKYF